MRGAAAGSSTGSDDTLELDDLSILDGAPKRPVESSFMGLVETVAWVGLRDERAALAARWHSLDRPDFDAGWIEAAEMMLRQDIRRVGGSIRGVVRRIAEQCAAGELRGKGRGSNGVDEIPANDWLGSTFFVGREPDSIQCGGLGAGWTHVQFLRDDVLALWPGAEHEEEERQSLRETRPRPDWYQALKSLVLQEDRRRREMEDRKPGWLAPEFPRAPHFRKKLLEMKSPTGATFPESTLDPAKVRRHLRNIKREIGL